MDTVNTTSPQTNTGKAKRIGVFLLVVVGGFLLFALPNVFFHIFKVNGGFRGINLLYTGVFQFASVTALVYWGLKQLGEGFRYIGLRANHWRKDAVLGLLVGLSWTILQFAVIIPATGGAGRADVRLMLAMMEDSWFSLFSYVVLGVVGGGVTEEIYNRGFFIRVLGDTFSNKKKGLYWATALSILFFAAGHLPANWVAWMDILIPTLAYTLLFLYTKRLTASIVAHGMYNMLAILLTYFLYYS